jgi:hypothetical protein
MTAHPLFDKGIEEFNNQEFFQCHETLEEFWRDYNGPEKELVQAIIQMSVAYYHVGRGNKIGAAKLFEKALSKASKYKDIKDKVSDGLAFGIDVETMCRDLEANLSKLAKSDNLSNWQYTKISFKK